MHIRFGLPAHPTAALKTLVKRADRACAWFEATQLAGFTEAEASKHFARPRFRGAAAIRLAPRPTDEVQRAFLDRFAHLSAGLQP